MTPATLVRRLVTASANLAVRSKSPPQHSEIGHTNTSTDLACSRFALYFISVVLVMPSRSTNSNATFKVFNCGYFSASFTASSARCLYGLAVGLVCAFLLAVHAAFVDMSMSGVAEN